MLTIEEVSYQGNPITDPAVSSGEPKQLDQNVLIPPGDGRNLVMENCMSCHSIAPTLVSAKIAGE